MPSTAIFGWPYPAPSAPNNVPLDLQSALEAIEATVAAGPKLSRYTFARTANGVANGAYIDLGTPPATPWSSGAIQGTNSRITITKACRVELVATTAVVLAAHAAALTLTTSIGVVYSVSPQAAAGNAYQAGVVWAAFMQAGETIDLTYRNLSAGAINLTAKSALTIGPAVAGPVIQS